MNIVSKGIIAIKDGVFLEKTYRYLFLKMTNCKIFNLIFLRKKINFILTPGMAHAVLKKCIGILKALILKKYLILMVL